MLERLEPKKSIFADTWELRVEGDPDGAVATMLDEAEAREIAKRCNDYPELNSLREVASAASDFELAHRDAEFAAASGGLDHFAQELRTSLGKYFEFFGEEDCRNIPV
ncbi:hypothetical protein GCM10007094_41300 [Pseudovibrio japonicus]|uniref:Uncharacterized protein n=2 Tax=Pseudovibrio japonicus TaxID=366534 RepID=A0ABQ3EN10_9HYPH|nr:hypothetical protein GCM10007094_41300 [Pseudovibrio japonicus]